jgi:hypothetical protein
MRPNVEPGSDRSIKAEATPDSVEVQCRYKRIFERPGAVRPPREPLNRVPHAVHAGPAGLQLPGVEQMWCDGPAYRGFDPLGGPGDQGLPTRHDAHRTPAAPGRAVAEAPVFWLGAPNGGFRLWRGVATGRTV